MTIDLDDLERRGNAQIGCYGRVELSDLEFAELLASTREAERLRDELLRLQANVGEEDYALIAAVLKGEQP